MRCVFEENGIKKFFEKAHRTRSKQNYSKELTKILDTIGYENTERFVEDFLKND